jgi:hypothetical protein
MDRFVTKKRPASAGPSLASDDTPPPVQKIRKKSNLSFNEKWLEMSNLRNWLQKVTNDHGDVAPKCKFCNLVLANHKGVLEKHSGSSKHKQMMSLNSSNKTITELVSNPETETKKLIKRAELKLAGLLAANNLPFVLMDTLVPLLANIFPDSNIAKGLQMGRTKATAVVTQILGPEFSMELTNSIKEPGSYFSLILDETTDTSSKKQCAITAIHCDTDINIKTSFLDMVEPESSTGESLFLCLKKSIEDRNIPPSNFVGFSSDTTNSMVGEHNSVFSRLKQEFENIVCLKCSCHSIHLVASKACLHLPRSLEDTLRNIGSHFSRSDKRQKRLLEMQEFFNTEIHKILSPATTRWLSLKQCVDRILEQLPALIPYFSAEVYDDPSKTTEEILCVLKNDLMIIYLEFLSYTLSLLTDFNVLFQSEVPLLHKLKPEIEKLLKTTYSNYMKIEISKKDPFTINHQHPDNLLPLDKLYMGVTATESIQNFLEKHPDDSARKEIEKIKKTCLKFYIEVVTQIKARFDFSDPMFEFISIVDPPIAQAFATQELSHVVKRFPYLSDIIDKQKLDTEWREHALLDHHDLGLDKTLPAAKYWQKVFSMKNALGEGKFPNLKVVIALLLVLPFSNASVERTFSNLKKIKTQDRNCLNTQTVVALMATKDGIAKQGGCIKFEPTNAMISKKINYNKNI